MKSKTVYLPSDTFCLTDDGVKEFFYKDQSLSGELDLRETNYKVGNHAVLISRTNISPNAIRTGQNTEKFYIRFDGLDGIAGNSNPSIKRLHGWRGTTDDISVTAYGERKITKIRKLKNGKVAVTVGPDLNPEMN